MPCQYEHVLPRRLSPLRHHVGQCVLRTDPLSYSSGPTEEPGLVLQPYNRVCLSTPCTLYRTLSGIFRASLCYHLKGEM